MREEVRRSEVRVGFGLGDQASIGEELVAFGGRGIDPRSGLREALPLDQAMMKKSLQAGSNGFLVALLNAMQGCYLVSVYLFVTVYGED